MFLMILVRNERQHSIIVGDSLTSDILGGINAGIATCWFNFRGFDHNPGIILIMKLMIGNN